MISVLKTSKPVSLAFMGGAALERVSASWREVPFLYLTVKWYLCSLISIFCSCAVAFCSWSQVAGGQCELLCLIFDTASGQTFQLCCRWLGILFRFASIIVLWCKRMFDVYATGWRRPSLFSWRRALPAPSSLAST